MNYCLITNGASLTNDIGVAYVAGDQIDNKEPVLCLPSILSPNCAQACRIDDKMYGIQKHSQANLYPSEIVTLGFLFELKGVSERAFYRWIDQDYLPLFPNLPDRFLAVPK